MKKITLWAFFALINISLCYSQSKPLATNNLTIGILQGGGGLVGFDFEQLITDRIGLSFGVGVISYGVSAHYHIKPGIESSSVALNYWHQGISDSHVQSIIGPSYVFKFGKLFSAQIGFGAIVEKGQLFEEAYRDFESEPNTVLLYSFGVFF